MHERIYVYTFSNFMHCIYSSIVLFVCMRVRLKLNPYILIERDKVEYERERKEIHLGAHTSFIDGNWEYCWPMEYLQRGF